MLFRTLFLATALTCTGVADAFAADCGPLKEAASLDLTPFGRGLFLAPLTFDGAAHPMLVNTAAGITNVTSAAVSTLGLHQLAATGFKSLDSNGNASQSYVQVDNLGMGAIQIPHAQLVVSPNPNAGANGAFTGNLALDLLAHFDVEFDFSAQKMNVFLPDHCPGQGLYWAHTIAAEVPIDLQRPVDTHGLRSGYGRDPLRDIHLIVSVTLDGKPFRAVINTAAPFSTFRASEAKRVFDVTADSPGSTLQGSVDGNPEHRAFGHVFSTLTFEGVSVSNPHITVIPDLFGTKDPNNSLVTGTRLSNIDDDIGPQITIGMDVLRKLRLYVALSERKLYLTPATPPSGAPTPAH